MADLIFKTVGDADAAALAACAALSACCFADQPAQQWQADQLGAHTTQNDNALFAGWVEDRLVAFALFTLVEDEGELLSICSDPASRRQGYGAALLRHALGCLRPQKIVLEVAANNLAAISLYERVGFQQIDRRKAYYAAQNGKRMDAIVMAMSHTK